MISSYHKCEYNVISGSLPTFVLWINGINLDAHDLSKRGVFALICMRFGLVLHYVIKIHNNVVWD